MMELITVVRKRDPPAVALRSNYGDGCTSMSGLASDVGLVGLVDQVGAALPVADEPSQQCRAEVANAVYVVDLRSAHAGQQVVDKITDPSVFAGEACYRIGQPRSSREESAIQSVRTLGDVDVFTEVGGEFDQRNVDALGPGA
jgi:hypothetical protein